MTVTLKGMTWSHPRGYDPMVACAKLWREQTGVEIGWDKRSLQDFESFPVEELARAYDLIVIDHPHVGQITAEGCLLSLDLPDRAPELAALANASVGPSFASYTWEGRQWALPIDAATQVQAYRRDLLPDPVGTFSEVLDLARDGAVVVPLRPPHSLMVFDTLAANLGKPCSVQPGALIDDPTGEAVWALLRQLADRLDPACLQMDPIAAYEQMAATGSCTACIPFVYNYISYALQGFRPNRIAFADIPVAGGQGPIGAVLGGTGLAVSAGTSHAKEAMDFAYWIAGAEVQRGPYAAAGGQPGHAAAWEDPGVNRQVDDGYARTRATLEGSYLRPRHDGYMPFQAAAAARITQGLKDREPAAGVLDDLNEMFAASFASANG